MRSKFHGILIVGGGWDVDTDSQCGAGRFFGKLREKSFMVRVLRLLVVEACWAATSFGSIEVEACQIELASRKVLMDASSALVSERRVFTLSAMAAANWVERLSAISSLIRNTTAQIAAIASLGILGRSATVRVSFVQSYGLLERIQPLESSHLQAS